MTGTSKREDTMTAYGEYYATQIMNEQALTYEFKRRYRDDLDYELARVDEASAAHHRQRLDDDGNYDQDDYDARYGRPEPIGWGWGGIER